MDTPKRSGPIAKSKHTGTSAWRGNTESWCHGGESLIAVFPAYKTIAACVLNYVAANCFPPEVATAAHFITLAASTRPCCVLLCSFREHKCKASTHEPNVQHFIFTPTATNNKRNQFCKFTNHENTLPFQIPGLKKLKNRMRPDKNDLKIWMLKEPRSAVAINQASIYPSRKACNHLALPPQQPATIESRSSE